MSESRITFHADGMHCHSCEHIIETSVKKLAGIQAIKADVDWHFKSGLACH